VAGPAAASRLPATRSARPCTAAWDCGTVRADGTAGTDAPAQAPEDAAVTDPYAAVRRAARGRREDYALERIPIERGGQAEVLA
jgi:hypothetical protein